MRWKQFFSPVQSINSKEAQNLLQGPADDIILLDVRQPSEYQKSHIAGAKLIPLPLLDESLDQLDIKKTILVY